MSRVKDIVIGCAIGAGSIILLVTSYNAGYVAGIKSAPNNNAETLKEIKRLEQILGFPGTMEK